MDRLKEIYWVLGGASAMQAREALGIDRRTLERKARGESRVKRSEIRTLQVDCAGDLPGFAKEKGGWGGWRFDPKTGYLVDPQGRDYRPGDLLALPLLVQLARRR